VQSLLVNIGMPKFIGQGWICATYICVPLRLFGQAGLQLVWGLTD